jgi:hypothetical protein
MVCMFVLVSAFSTTSLALDLLGPPMAGLDQGQYSAGLEYSYSNMNVEVSGPYANVPLRGDAVIDMQAQKYFARFGYGITGDWELYGLFGLSQADMEADDGGDDFEGDDDWAYGIGTKKTLSQEGNTTWGAALQYTRGKSSDKFNRSSTFGSGVISVSNGYRMQVKWYDVMLAVGPTIEENEQFSWYCGPFLHFLEGDIEVKGSSGRQEHEIEQKLELGAFLGALFQLDQGVSVNIEGQLTPEAALIGAGIQIRR